MDIKKEANKKLLGEKKGACFWENFKSHTEKKMEEKIDEMDKDSLVATLSTCNEKVFELKSEYGTEISPLTREVRELKERVTAYMTDNGIECVHRLAECMESWFDTKQTRDIRATGSNLSADSESFFDGLCAGSDSHFRRLVLDHDG